MGTWALAPTAVLVVHPPSIPLPALPRLLHPRRLVVVVLTVSTKVRDKDSIGLRHQTAWALPSTLMEMLQWTRWRTYIANNNTSSSSSNRWCKQDKYSRHKYPRRC